MIFRSYLENTIGGNEFAKTSIDGKETFHLLPLKIMKSLQSFQC